MQRIAIKYTAERKKNTIIYEFEIYRALMIWHMGRSDHSSFSAWRNFQSFHGVQRKMISVDNFFVFLRLLFFALLLLFVT